MIFLTLWFGVGLIGGALMNHHMRTKFNSLHIIGYWSHRPPDEAATNFDGLSFFLVCFTALGGPCGLIAALLAKFAFSYALDDNTPWGLSLKFTPWTIEEALKEFPNDAELRRRANEIYNRTRSSLA